MTDCSLLITTYNWPAALCLCLVSIRNQSVLPNEIIIADDGSRDDTRTLIEKETKNFPVPIIHVWQADEGFQLSKIRNKGIAKASYDYIIQIDGDVTLHPHFIRDHLSFAQSKTFVSGSRVFLSSAQSTMLFNKSRDVSTIHRIFLNNSLNSLRIGVLRNLLGTRYKNSGKNKYYVKGCNMGYWRKDAIGVNGFNEAFVGWGPEDSEFAARLINHGIQKRFIKFGAVMYHLYHKEADRSRENPNYDILRKTIEDKSTFCKKGISQYLTPTSQP